MNPIIRHINTGTQDVIIEKWPDDLRLTLSGDLQFSFKEDNIYTSAMSDIPMSCIGSYRNIRALILGGGDGFIASHLRTYSNVISIDLCEIDAGMIELCRNDIDISEFNHNIFNDPKLKVHIEDAFSWVAQCRNKYDLIIADFPDAHAIVLSKLYSSEFYNSISKILSSDGIFITLGSEVKYTPSCFECIIKTMRKVFSYSKPFTINMPTTYGNMGIIMASQSNIFGVCSNTEKYIPTQQDTIGINTLLNNKAFYYFQQETLSSGFIPGITNKKSK